MAIFRNGKVRLSSSEALPGTRSGSNIREIYDYLAKGKVLTTLDAVNCPASTVCLTKYISVLRNKYNIPIKDHWVEVGKNKRVKHYWFAD